MSYPECDQYECEECPRNHDCVDKDLDIDIDIPLSPETDAFLDYLEQRLGDMERRIYELQEFSKAVQRAFAALIKTYEREEE